MRKLEKLSCFLSAALLAGCTADAGNKAADPHYPPGSEVLLVFQDDKVPEHCRVFSHRMMITPDQASGSQIRDELIKNAGKNGADLVLIGLARESMDEQDGYSYLTYGPKNAYNFQNGWRGWKYGFGDWNGEGSIVPLDFEAAAEQQGNFYRSLYIQNIYLTCRNPGSE
ncbi:MAG: hypothetical protein CSB24_00075 [Deltaproteobacteria bacterium]|nr:MAG: hypothetical protein CSB24_00075 [Deltaproteobacteria bacterium]